MSVLLLFATFILVGIFYYYVVTPLNYWKSRGVEQGNPIWLFGHYWKNFIGWKNGAETFQEIYKQNPDLRYTGFYRFSSPTFVVKDPKLIKKMIVEDFDTFLKHPQFIPTQADPLWANHLFNLTGSKWRCIRTILNPCFTSNQINDLLPQMIRCADNLTSHLSRKNQEVVTLEIGDTFSRYVSDVIATIVFGVTVNSFTNPNNKFYELSNKISDTNSFFKTFGLKLVWFVPAIKNFVKMQVFPDDAAAYFRKIVDDNIKSKKEKDTMPPNMLHIFTEAMKNGQTRENIVDNKAESNSIDEIALSNEDLMAQAVSFFITGLDPVASSISFTVYELAVNPEVQKRLRREIFATLKSCEGKLTYEALLDMKYLDMVVLESFRKWPPYTIIARDCTKPYTINPVLPGEKVVRIEEGIEIKLPVYAIQHDPKYFPEPERFEPDRFSEENKKNIHPCTYFPFGLGPRTCIGAMLSLVEIKVMLFHLLHRFEIVPVEKTAVPLVFYKNTILNLKPVGGTWLGFKRYDRRREST
uniref:cytochrome P450 9e2 n=1 Tax=Anoplophora glabripennis TaxID=217634 RepID=UPI000E316666|nr:cytochrome P450 9e2 [Anoplophora glabripennis]